MGEEETGMDVWKDRIQQDITDMKQRQQQNEADLKTAVADIHKLQISDQLQNREIDALNVTLGEIKQDTSFIRRKITGAIITATITAVVAGLIGIAIATIYGGA